MATAQDDLSQSASKKRLLAAGQDDDPAAGVGDPSPTKNDRKTSVPPNGYICNLCQTPGHWIQQCPDRRKHNEGQQRKRQKKTKTPHVPVPGVDPSPRDIQLAQSYQLWLAKHTAPTCFCQLPSRLKKVKPRKGQQQQPISSSRAVGKYFFFCSKKKEDNPCRFARLADEIIKEQKRKEGKAQRASKKHPSSDETAMTTANDKDNEE